ncbi:high affinity copper uptake protein 1 [Hydra vulgaris]|uniref:high affinity copper uptake protein 1 n=1 Tax=Hydra vulgaris TaxID=6087 RepID=UPI000640C8F5|nr:high affinity copper uptake protein 1 [Hydra vulgaris]
MNTTMMHDLHDVTNMTKDHEPMPMYFVLGNDVTLIFKGWHTKTNAELIGSCIALALIAFMYEGLKVLREVIKYNYSGFNNQYSIMFSWLHILQTVLHMVVVFIGYFLMLAFMTYNTWICLAVIIGAGVGYFAFGWKINSIPSTGDHCN